MTQEQRRDYLPTYFSQVLTAATLNNGSIEEIDGWKSCGILMPPGCKVDNPRTLFQAGFLSALWNMGFGGINVGFNISHLYPSLSDHQYAANIAGINTSPKRCQSKMFRKP